MKKISSTIREIISDAKKGKMFILVDNKDRENEGDLVVPASKINPKTFSLPMALHASVETTAESIPPLIPITTPRFLNFSKV